MVDADREKISKSKQGQGGYEKPQTSEAYVKKYGADVVRLWVASQDFRNDIIVSEERISKVAETYRVLRNALRYQLSNLYDFDPAKHTRARRPADRAGPLDTGRVLPVGAGSHRGLRPVTSSTSFIRRSASSSPSSCRPSITTWSRTGFTPTRPTRPAAARPRPPCTGWSSASARCWRRFWPSPPTRPGSLCPGKTVDSAHQLTWQPLGFRAARSRSGPPGRPCLSCASWRCRSWRRPGRRKQIGKALEAKLTFAGSSPALTAAQAHLESLRELLNVSQLEIQPGGEGAVTVPVSKAAGQKCERCWHWETDVGSHPEHPTICARCVKAVQESARA